MSSTLLGSTDEKYTLCMHWNSKGVYDDDAGSAFDVDKMKWFDLLVI